MLKTSFSLLLFCLMGCKPPKVEATQQIQTPEAQILADTFDSETELQVNASDTLNRRQESMVLKRIHPKFRKLNDISTLKPEELPGAYVNLLKTNKQYADSSLAFLPFFRLLNSELDKHYSLIEQTFVLPDSARLQIASAMSDLRGKLAIKPELSAESK